MPAFLLDINLQQLPDEYLAGEWRVADRVLNRTAPDSALALATRFLLSPGMLKVEAPQQEKTGSWAVQRDELLQRPYLQLTLPQEDTRALITRMRRSPDGRESRLNLYFLSGMELQLTRP
ncbi:MULTISPECIES: hypothetical protein [Hymenobacter]|uniref:Uncharacterized protein n=2 Tax=Hymenobacter TaxID=89966 RepID=A0ABS6X6A2_9BACT|nr:MULTISPECIES: hypothetical protein [Hymenobacter]MBO3269838.1 hypothetical protein [Hymenobacter defluvii]MBW3130982.1 hypothetical protein [Hymenobacter profundi]QNE39479.1 hypothetical protein F1C16_07895 [Hymenobacter sp. NBH84]